MRFHPASYEGKVKYICKVFLLFALGSPALVTNVHAVALVAATY